LTRVVVPTMKWDGRVRVGYSRLSRPSRILSSVALARLMRGTTEAAAPPLTTSLLFPSPNLQPPSSSPSASWESRRGGGTPLLAHRVGEALRGRAPGLSAGSHAAGRPESRHSDARTRAQVVEIVREIRRLTVRPRKRENGRGLALRLIPLRRQVRDQQIDERAYFCLGDAFANPVQSSSPLWARGVGSDADPPPQGTSEGPAEAALRHGKEASGLVFVARER